MCPHTAIYAFSHASIHELTSGNLSPKALLRPYYYYTTICVFSSPLYTNSPPATSLLLYMWSLLSTPPYTNSHELTRTHSMTRRDGERETEGPAGEFLGATTVDDVEHIRL